MHWQWHAALARAWQTCSSSTEMAVLAADVGGTKTILARADKQRRLTTQTFANKEYLSFRTLLSQFLKQNPMRATAACLGVASPVIDGKASTKNEWRFDEKKLSAVLHCPVRLLNDVECAAWGLTCLRKKQVLALSRVQPLDQATKAVIAVGTGLGEAVLHWTGSAWTVLATEGGRAELASRTKEEQEFKQFLAQHKIPTIVESALSGDGLVNAYLFLRQTTKSAHKGDLALAKEGAAAITHAAAEGDKLSLRAIEFFLDQLAAEAQQVAFRTKALGGVYLAGGVVRKLLPFLNKRRFVRAVLNHPTVPELLRRIPLSVVLDEELSLKGAVMKAEEIKSQ